MRAAVLSDIHANLEALEAVLRDCKLQGVAEFWLLGDYVDYGADNRAVLAVMESLHAQHVIAGNHDACLFLPQVAASATPHGRRAYEHTKKMAAAFPDAFAWLRSVASTPQIMLPEQKICLVHGTLQDPYWGKFLPGNGVIEPLFAAMEAQDVTTMFLGHSHVSFLLSKGGRRMINPGSVGQPRNGIAKAQYVIWEDGAVQFCQVAYDVETAAAKIRGAGLPEILADRLFTGF